MTESNSPFKSIKSTPQPAAQPSAPTSVPRRTTTGQIEGLRNTIRTLTIMTLVMAVGSAYTTWRGATTMMDASKHAMDSTWIPVIMASVSGGFAMVLWSLMYRIFPVVSARKQKLMAFGMVGAIPLIFGLSTTLSIIGFGGHAAVMRHYNNTIAQADGVLNQILTRRTVELNTVAPVLEQLEIHFQQMATDEALGVHSGIAGTGTVHKTFISLSGAFGNLARSISDNTEVVQEMNEDAAEIIDEMRTIVFTEMTANERTSEFALKLNELNALLAQIHSTSVIASVQAMSERVDRLAIINSPDESTAVGRTQSETIKRLDGAVKEAKKMIDDTIKQNGKVDIELPRLSVIDQGSAIFTYWWEIKPAWAVSLALDYAPLIFLFLLSVFLKPEEDEEGDTAGGISSAEQKELDDARRVLEKFAGRQTASS